MKNLPVPFFILLSTVLYSQNIKIQPYLQDASPHSISILWETDSGEESTVEWGLTEALGNSNSGTAEATEGTARLHQVTLDNLERFTPYYYRVKTGNAVSEIYRFKTPPFANDHQSFQLIAMSDMQRDGSHPDKFAEVIQDGVLDYLADEFGDIVSEQLALVMIPGDLVVNGNNFGQWENHFFGPGAPLFSQVPVYPVPGNHENNSTYFFQYFQLPTNGSSGFEEHWWYKDYGNVRIIGLDSNAPYNNQEQLDWLEDVLDQTCALDSIDFVFAQLHHPHKSELWTPGESNYTGEVIDQLEQFSTQCNKPSIHFFGHTHGYSRGQSRDHKHLWINVATAGGAIDNWGEFPNFDYDEFSVSQDEWGFVSVEVTAGDEPKMTIKRISRGNETTFQDNTVTDSLTICRADAPVDSPTPFFPIEVEIAPECVVLMANAYSAPDNTSQHGQSHWQVSTASTFAELAAESWKNYENWYFAEDTQAGDDLTDEVIDGLAENTSYWWRVRYRDRQLNWSAWSTPVNFTTGPSLASPNLLLNPGAEDSLSQWIVTEGVVEALTDGICNGVSPHSGNRYFIVGGLCEHSEVGRCIQNVNVVAYADSIDTGTYQANFGGFLSNYGGSDLPEMRLIFFDENSFELGTSPTLSTLNNSWTSFSEWVNLPAQTRLIQVELTGTRNAGTDNDSYFDDLFLTLGASTYDCDDIFTSTTHPVSEIPTLQVAPNPVRDLAVISPGRYPPGQSRLHLVNSLGEKVDAPVRYDAQQISVEVNQLPAGTYFFWLKAGNQLIGKGQFVVQ